MLTLTFDKPSYNVGDTITVTVNDPHLLATTETETDTYTETDGDHVTVATTINHPAALPGTLVSSSGRVYTRGPITGSTLVYTATA